MLMRLHFILLTILSLLSSSWALAEEIDGTYNFAYAVFTGTGRYTLNDRTIYVFRAPLSFDLREADHETGKIGFRLLLPIAAGLNNYDSIEDLPDLVITDLASITVVPGVEFIIPLQDNWTMNPFVQAGLGWDTSSSSNAFVVAGGTRTRAWFGKDSNWLIGGELLFARNHPNKEEEKTRFSRIGLGAEYKWQTSWRVFDRRISWHPRLIHWRFIDPVEYEEPQEQTTVHYSTEVGLSFGLDKAINMLGYKFTQGGIGYEKGDQFTAIKFYTTFPF
jgi:hypothetical protein